MKGLRCLALLYAAVMLKGQTIPRIWDETELENALLPAPVKGAIVKPAPADYYYRMPERVMYRRYPVYARNAEPPGYLEKLATVEPEITFDVTKLKTEQDWIAAGGEVFRYPVGISSLARTAQRRDMLERAGIPPASDGTYPQLTFIVQKKGVVMGGWLSCATCHTRIQPDGRVIEGAQGSVTDQIFGVGLSRDVRTLFGTPWLKPDPRLDKMSQEELNAFKGTIPVGVMARHGTGVLTPVQIPDLIGVGERRYLDHTGLMRNRGESDLMRYAALNNGLAPAGMDLLSDYSGFIPMADADGRRPPPEKLARYSEAQLLALTKFLVSLKPPPNPNRESELSRKGQKIFGREGCGRCHTPPLYTSNKLTPVAGFVVPEEHRKKYDIEPTVVGTDPALALETRRSTGYYKVPSLRGVWYRGPFEHSGSVATLEDWFDAKRLRDDYVPTGFKGFGVERRAVKGHPFGLSLSADEKKSLIAFLKTL